MDCACSLFKVEASPYVVCTEHLKSIVITGVCVRRWYCVHHLHVSTDYRSSTQSEQRSYRQIYYHLNNLYLTSSSNSLLPLVMIQSRLFNRMMDERYRLFCNNNNRSMTKVFAFAAAVAGILASVSGAGDENMLVRSRSLGRRWVTAAVCKKQIQQEINNAVHKSVPHFLH